MNYEDTRISKLRTYLLNIIDTLANNNKSQINANMLSNDVNNYSLDKIPTNTEASNWIVPKELNVGNIKKRREVYSFRSRKSYSQDTINNLNNIGFFEQFEKMIQANNDKGVLPEINGIQSIKCLDCGTMNSATTNSAEFDIQIEITYIDFGEEDRPSL